MTTTTKRRRGRAGAAWWLTLGMLLGAAAPGMAGTGPVGVAVPRAVGGVLDALPDACGGGGGVFTVESPALPDATSPYFMDNTRGFVQRYLPDVNQNHASLDPVGPGDVVFTCTDSTSNAGGGSCGSSDNWRCRSDDKKDCVFDLLGRPVHCIFVVATVACHRRSFKADYCDEVNAVKAFSFDGSSGTNEWKGEYIGDGACIFSDDNGCGPTDGDRHYWTKTGSTWACGKLDGRSWVCAEPAVTGADW